jgi:transposase, IS6 family
LAGFQVIIIGRFWTIPEVSLSYRNLEELMAEPNLAVDHVTVWRWVQRYAPELDRRCRRNLRNDESVLEGR